MLIVESTVDLVLPLNLMIPRRRFLRLTGAAGLLAAYESLVSAYARTAKPSRTAHGSFGLTIGRQTIEIDARRAAAIAINGTVPGPLVRLREGQDAMIRVTNQLVGESSSIYWHGLILPYRMDGVPGVTFPGIAPGETPIPIASRSDRTARIGIIATPRRRSSSGSTDR